MGEWKPLFIVLFILVLIGVVIPLSLSGFQEVGDYNNASVVSPVIESFNSAWCIGETIDRWIPGNQTMCLSTASLVGNDVNSYLVSYLSAFTFIPNWIVIPIVIFLVLGSLYTIIKLLPTT